MGRRQGSQGRGDGNTNENQVGHSPNLSQNLNSSTSQLVPYLTQPSMTPESYHPSPLSSIRSQNVDEMGNQSYDYGCTSTYFQGYVNEDELAFDDVEDVEADEAVQVTGCIARRKPTRLTRHPRYGTE
ncbi:hypothetical protein L1987_46518 [Smallanthus sonchifolius]|uniref:Uncharacterized protein n=1 Tax=Smallanthus sonchifolius TaxID=185202 RepID=A0ACB9FZN3_9ASTR|nr:hypothetical protein L1987_46518 [Smallanthus sonchifolius]